MRTPTTNLDATLEAEFSQSGYLVSITVAGNAIRLCTLDVDFDFDGFSWLSADVAVSGINWDGDGQQAGEMMLGDADLIWWSYALNLLLQDAPVAIWACDGLAPGEAEPLWQGRVGAISKGDQQVTCSLVVASDASLVPRRRVQTIVPAYLLAPPGTVIQVGAQQYVIGRQFDQGRAPAPKVDRRPRVKHSMTRQRRARRG